MEDTIVERLKVQIYENRERLGRAAARDVVRAINDLLLKQDMVNIIFAAAASQNEFLDALTETREVDWSRINAFHMDEYIGLSADHPQRFANYLRRKLFDKLSFNEVFYLNEAAQDFQQETERYSTLLKQYPPDITCMGIGENTHLAFNDPHVADFNDPALVKVVDIDEPCKQQQVNEGCFSTVKEVPAYAYTLTIPVLLNVKFIACMVPGKSKAKAVARTLFEEMSELYPSTSLRQHRNAVLYLDKESAEEFLARKPMAAETNA